MDVLTASLLWHLSDVPLWLRDALAGKVIDEAEIAMAFGSASQVLGRRQIMLDGSDARRARAEGVPWLIGPCTADELARVILVRAVAAGSVDPPALVRRLFTTGDNEERIAVLRALPLLESPERFVPLAAEGCRTNVKTIFEAIACENPFPARHLPEAAFCQMVLKAIFVGTRIARVEGLTTRVTPELCRMARGYASERAAAGRPVPDDIHALLSHEGKGAPS
jgi:hypothetical protein